MTSHILTIALLQITPSASLSKNQEIGENACRQAKEKGADIALFPEMWSDSYRISGRPAEQWGEEAIGVDSDFVHAFAKLAKQLDMAIGITLCEAHPNGPRNTFVLFDRFGDQKLMYSKVHTCDFGDEKYLTPGDDFHVCTLNTAQGDVQVGAMICYDREFPESARILMLKGAELILVPNACPMEINRLSQLRGRAYENMLAIATCNYPSTVRGCNGHSTLFDGVAFTQGGDDGLSRDMCVAEGGEDEGIVIARCDLDQLRDYRRSEVQGNAYRHPTKYGLLVDPHRHPPFIRADYRA